jgi:hypothetical protein
VSRFQAALFLPCVFVFRNRTKQIYAARNKAAQCRIWSKRKIKTFVVHICFAQMGKAKKSISQ